MAQGVDADKLQELLEKATEKTDHAKGREVRQADPEKKADRLVAKKLRRALKKRKVTVNFSKTPFTEVLDFLRDITGLNIVLSPKARKEYAETEVTLRVKKITLKSCLNLILQQVGKDLVYGVKHGVMWIGLKEEFKPEMVLELYYVGDIIQPPPDFPAPKMGLGKNGLEIR
jgi:type II secretory pathway component HofQ